MQHRLGFVNISIARVSSRFPFTLLGNNELLSLPLAIPALIFQRLEHDSIRNDVTKKKKEKEIISRIFAANRIKMH